MPKEAKKEIEAGRLKGKHDINLMWRIKKLTEVFGPAGFGWYTEIVRTWTEANEKKYENGQTVYIPYLDDDAYKKVYTDAISVAAKALGVGADVAVRAGVPPCI